MTKFKILDVLEIRWLSYDVVPGYGVKDGRGLAETLIGYKFTSTNSDGADLEYNERNTRRNKHARARHSAKESKRARLRKRAKGR